MSFSEILRKLNNHIGTHKVHLCPEVKGRLVNNGAPLADVRISRSLVILMVNTQKMSVLQVAMANLKCQK